ncbi:platelet-activating factor acetylhydrolase plasma/intracellular isoform II [Rhodopirellula maiorica SM1]|uniref:Platelet-activating factor acetylhydrolase plasma/intracellular isoform II n=1 Tax=Rhodopirellula maiorica SM1 TaxID=1265738 RepID=M5RD18_9BACT|nr:platelet-activating factor acetylhydrolase plasma/intracellular isoform II [Rhodopirellula maiorica]EMI17373.1 platelet-activating factor acetylhydrolase plasma/intracellular isoform II [Rhodopirellula maiorica SM1]
MIRFQLHVCRCLWVGWLVSIGLGMKVDANDDAKDNVAVKQIDFEPVDTSRDRTVPLRVYLAEQDAAQPIVLFSHGLGGSRENNRYLGEHWAKNGFVGVFMQHPGSDREVIASGSIVQRLSKLKSAASAKNASDRFADVSFVIDQIQQWNKEAGHPLFGKLDLQRIGMSGHSFGAVTTMGMAGRKFLSRQNYYDQRIDAFLAMSPSLAKMISAEKAFGEIRHPVLCMTGTHDDSPIDPQTTPESRQQVYKALPSGDKFQLVFDGGHHFTFGDSSGFRTRHRDASHHPAIQKISLAFWNAYLRGDGEAEKWLKSEKPQSDGTLKPSDTWQWK